MQRTFDWLTRHGAAIRNACVVGVLASAGVFVYATLRFGPTRASAWFQGLAVVLALVALVAAGLAAAFTYPSYREWWLLQQKVPDVRLHFEVGTPTLQNPSEVDDGQLHEIRATKSVFEMRVAVINDGQGTVSDGVLNICVREDCTLEVMDDPRLVHYPMPGTALNGEIEPDEVVRVRATIARDAFPPGIRMFHIRVRAPISETHCVLATASGVGLETVSRRVFVKVTPP